MKIKNNIKRILCLALCLFMMAGMLLTAVSCDNGEGGGNSDPTAGNPEIKQEKQEKGEVAVIKALEDIDSIFQINAASAVWCRQINH